MHQSKCNVCAVAYFSNEQCKQLILHFHNKINIYFFVDIIAHIMTINSSDSVNVTIAHLIIFSFRGLLTVF